MTEAHDVRPTLAFDSAADRSTVPSAVVVWPGDEPVLADLVSTFAHLGLRVATHEQLPARRVGVETATAHRFRFSATELAWRPEVGDLLEEAFARGCRGETEFDGFTGLIATAGLCWRDSVLVRAASRYLGQVGLEVSESGLLAILHSHTGFVTSLVALFDARFTPELPDREAVVRDAEAEVASRVAAAATHDEDRVLRALWSFVSAILRTNWFQLADGADGPVAKSYASFKLDPSLLSITTAVVPHREIFVHSPVVEGSHVRGGAVARGGLRMSDRADDYRTEVLGLMKTQTVKNALIVPAGAKGAFVVRGGAESPRHAYATFVEGLLDVTDNVVESEVVTPPRTVTYDGPDAYLVVAADKGTARFSDVANEVAARREFWLGDGFASGGSVGYNHKAMGITARGAWVSVRRHFAERGLDVAADAFTVVGIGDMAGDVFGNGMLLSRTIRLVGAFDHRSIFLDPEPDAEESYAERERLAGLANGSWEDFDRSVISAGGGVWPRSSKSIPLSPQVRARLGVREAELSPDEVVKALLRAEVDLLWNGGIGTYVTASAQSHAEACDPHNDAVRVDAAQLRCRVVGEGGNLGLTQAARVEYALAGGAVNADFIDNAAGVCTSDLEVNIKIALDAAVRGGHLGRGERDRLLAEAADDVAGAVLADAERQTLAISLAEAHAPFLLSKHERLIGNLEHEGGISRSAEGLPSSAELAIRGRQGLGLVRPEIAVLLAQSKNLVRSELLRSGVVDDPVFTPMLTGYFPEQIRRRVPAEIARHRLAREIVAVRLAGELVDRVGPGMIRRLEERLGVTSSEIARGYAVVREVFDLDRWWREAAEVPSASHATRLRLLSGVQDVIERSVAWLLRNSSAGLDPRREIARFAKPVAELRRALPGLSGVLDADLPGLRVMGEALPLSDTAIRFGRPVTEVAEAHGAVGSELGLDWLARRFGTGVGGTSHWDALAASAVADDLAVNWHLLLRQVMSDQDLERPAADRTGRISALVGELRQLDRLELAHVCVVNAELSLAVPATA